MVIGLEASAGAFMADAGDERPLWRSGANPPRALTETHAVTGEPLVGPPDRAPIDDRGYPDPTGTELCLAPFTAGAWTGRMHRSGEAAQRVATPQKQGGPG